MGMASFDHADPIRAPFLRMQLLKGFLVGLGHLGRNRFHEVYMTQCVDALGK